jgi:predicted RNA-binding protein associated with RNAse of E/G family/GNAT superfamily N-acetyltransferase
MRRAYLTDMVYVFPANELKPCEAIYEEMLEGKFLACGLFAGEELAAYAFTGCVPGYGYLFTQYVVVKERYRSQGVGSVLMEELAKRYGGFSAMLIDVEDPLYGEDEAEKRHRRKRMRFYLKNGFRLTRVKSHVYGVDYVIMVRDLSAQTGNEEILEAARTLYHSMARPGAFPDRYRVMLRPEERGMERRTWTRIEKRRFRMARVETEGFHGMAGLLEIDAVQEPLTVRSVLSEAVIADTGYSWLQLSPDRGSWWLTVMYDQNGELVQYYFDITLRNFIAEDGEPRFVDLYLDVVMDPEGYWALLDQDELREARNLQNITESEYRTALERAAYVIGMVDGKEAHWRALCAKCAERLKALPFN